MATITEKATMGVGRSSPPKRQRHGRSPEGVHGTAEAQKVSMAAYHLEGEANQWWQWIRRTFRDEGQVISWEKFEEEL
ncbi:hypothetical protein Pint_22708 [Pistacia integerrima]|uniref:Uncharacterized protein n=1 Tax=Pistacia integerrima TaxID=434235 RepID=A0ACC0YHI7_9ROSI|nr:hypothetical protein Pint_22708 [Pistacia integerrima]